MTSSNWNPGPIASGDVLQFDGSDTSPTSNNGETSGTAFSLRFDSGGYDLTGNGIDLADVGGPAIQADNPSGSNALDLPLTLTAGARAAVTNAAASLILNNTLAAGAGTTLTIQGAGSVVLSSDSDASGFSGTVDDQGTLEVDSATGPGSVMIDGGTLRGTGTVGAIAATTGGGSLSPGNGPGRLTARE